MMVTARDILNRLKWNEGESLDEATIYYVHRGSPGDSRAVSGADVIKLDKFCFELASGSCIPYHRVYKITHKGRTVFERYKQQGTGKGIYP
jgi:hypothetical protein